MKKMTIEAFTEPTNYAVVRLPERKFPGVVFQGDSLWSMYSLAQEARQALDGGQAADARDSLVELCDKLGRIVKHYETLLGEKNIELPYSK